MSRSTRVSLQSLIGTIQFVDLRTRCRNTHSPKDRTGAQVSAEVALDGDGNLRRGYEKSLNEAGELVGYALRSDAPVYGAAEDLLRNAIREATTRIASVCVKVGGGAYVLPEYSREEWPTVVAGITALVASTNEQLNAMQIDKTDPASPRINDFLLAQGRKTIRMQFQPLLHSPLRLADPDAETQAREFVRSTWEIAHEIIAAVRTADPETIGNVIREAGAIENAILDPAASKTLREVLTAAKAAKAAAEQERRKQKSIERAGTRGEREGAAGRRDSAQVTRWTEERDAARLEREAALQALATAETAMDQAFGRFGLIELGDDLPVEPAAEETSIRGALLEVEEEIQLSEAARVAAAASRILAEENDPTARRGALLEIDGDAQIMPDYEGPQAAAA